MDPNPDGSFRGWADRLAERLARGRAGPALRQPRRARQARAPGARRAARRRRRARARPRQRALAASTTCCASNVDVAAVGGRDRDDGRDAARDRRRRDHGHVPRPRAGEPARQPRRGPRPAPERDDPRPLGRARREARRPRGAPGLLRPAAVGRRPAAREPRGPPADRARRRPDARPRGRRRRLDRPRYDDPLGPAHADRARGVGVEVPRGPG